MQIVNQPCARCEERVLLAIGADFCPRCAIAFHVDCLENEEACPSCGCDYRDVQRAEQALEDNARDEAERTGKRYVFSALAIVVASSIVAAILAYTVDPTRSVPSVVRVGVTVTLAVAVWTGARWAYWLSMCGLCGAVIMGLLAGFSALLPLAIAYALVIGLLAHPRSRAFLEDQRARRRSPD